MFFGGLERTKRPFYRCLGADFNEASLFLLWGRFNPPSSFGAKGMNPLPKAH
jgi:hypothetical protein